MWLMVDFWRWEKSSNPQQLRLSGTVATSYRRLPDGGTLPDERWQLSGLPAHLPAAPAGGSRRCLPALSTLLLSWDGEVAEPGLLLLTFTLSSTPLHRPYPALYCRSTDFMPYVFKVFPVSIIILTVSLEPPHNCKQGLLSSSLTCSNRSQTKDNL